MISAEQSQSEMKPRKASAKVEPAKQEEEDKKEEEEEPSVPFCDMFRFATGCDYFLMVLGSIGAIAVGGALPAFAFIWG